MNKQKNIETMHEQVTNNLLTSARKLADVLYKRGADELALGILQLASTTVQTCGLPKGHKVICTCGRWLRIGKEIDFFNNVGICYSCDGGLTDIMEQHDSDFEKYTN